MKMTNEAAGQEHPRRLGKAAAGTLAGLCMGVGMYGLIHGLRTGESTLQLTLSAITLCCGILLLHIPKTGEKENR